MTPWWLTFLVVFSVATVVMGALCWQLWRKRNDDETQNEGSRYFEDKVRSEMQPTRSEGMTVDNLIYFLQQHNPAATVVLWDHAPYQGRVSKLGVGEVQLIQLEARESVGLLLLEPWVDGGNDLQGPFPGIVLGSK